MIAILFAAALALPTDPSLESQISQACKAPTSTVPEVTGVRVADELAETADLPRLRVTHVATGAWMNVYYEPRGEAAARSRAAGFGGQLALLERELGDNRTDAHWDDVVLTRQRDYAPPRGDHIATRWIIATTDEGELAPGTEEMILSVMPHEQTHEYQTRARARLPRWIAEGHATWIGLKVLSRLDPGLGTAGAVKREADLAAATEPVALGGWGGVRPKREAILRQLSPEDRVRFENDPTFQPNGSFSFNSDDLISDESNSLARYGAAWKIFVGLEERHGASAVHAWVAEVTATDVRMSSADLAASFRSHFNEDLAPLLR